MTAFYSPLAFAATREALRKAYPTDQATGYTVGQLRGLWSVTFPNR